MVSVSTAAESVSKNGHEEGAVMKIRIKFQKQGTVRFIGHLDVMRYFQKVMRRAEVDIRYSEGFSPHQIMSFASPLSVGLISHAEYVDIDVNSSGNSTGMVRRLNEVSAEGLEVLSYRELPETAKNAMSLVAAADYTFWFKEGFEPEDGSSVEEFFGKFLTFCKSETIPFVKQTKKGERTVDLRPLICEARIAERKEYVPAMVADWYPDLENETVEEEKQAEGICVFLRLLSGSAANGKPEQVLQAFYESLGLTYRPFAIQVEREELYADEGAEGAPEYVPLEAYGSEIV